MGIWWPLLTSVGTKHAPNARHTVTQNTYAHKTKSKQTNKKHLKEKLTTDGNQIHVTCQCEIPK